MEKVRDKSINSWDIILNGEGTTDTPKKVKQQLSKFTSEQIDVIRWMLPKIVDTSLHFFLSTIDEEKNIDIIIKKEIGELLSVCNECECFGGLPGKLYTEDGWIEIYSKERYEEI